MKETIQMRWSLITGGLAAILASSCCLGPLLLVMLGFSGSWLSNLTALEPFKPIFLLFALVAMAMAWWRIYRPKCQDGDVCSIQSVNLTYKLLFWLGVLLIVVAIAFPYVMPFFYE